MGDIVYLDTNHLSELALRPDGNGASEVLQLLATARLRLGLSLLHLQELSAPGFAGRAEVGRLLDRVPVSWAPFIEKVFDLEVTWGLERALTGATHERQVFTPSFEHAFGAEPEANIPISRMLDAFAMRPDLRKKLPEAARYGVRGDAAMKRNAALIRAPDQPLLSRIRDMAPRITASGLYMPAPYPPEELLRRAGGLPGFPAYNVFLGLARTRLGDDLFPTEENDLIDEWHASYAPYVSAMALDRRTVGRFRAASLPQVDRVTHRLDEVPAILARAATR